MEQSLSLRSVSKKSQRRSEEEIFKAVVEFERTANISIKEFAKRHQVSKATIYNWQKRYRSKVTGRDELKGFIPISLASGNLEHEGALFAECAGIKFYQWVEPAYLKELLR